MVDDVLLVYAIVASELCSAAFVASRLCSAALGTNKEVEELGRLACFKECITDVKIIVSCETQQVDVLKDHNKPSRDGNENDMKDSKLGSAGIVFSLSSVDGILHSKLTITPGLERQAHVAYSVGTIGKNRANDKPQLLWLTKHF
ncbi:hypothetical protein JHK82_012638 [Glycine max]|nr:hypothetical protein JHK86_012657 [Glycine max]KAG5154669.1 hypothetical protein JHK82_012638 [Glycine max]